MSLSPTLKLLRITLRTCLPLMLFRFGAGCEPYGRTAASGRRYVPSIPVSSQFGLSVSGTQGTYCL